MSWLGATAKLREVESRLKLAEVDWEMMRRWVEDGHKRSPETRLEIYDGAGHAPQLEVPERFVASVQRWLKENGKAAAIAATS